MCTFAYFQIRTKKWLCDYLIPGEICGETDYFALQHIKSKSIWIWVTLLKNGSVEIILLPEGFLFGIVFVTCLLTQLIKECEQYIINPPSPLLSLGSPGASSDSKKPVVISFWSCVCSKLFFWHLVWLSVMQLRHYLFIGTLNPMLEQLAGEDPALGTERMLEQFSGMRLLFKSFEGLPFREE